MEARGGELEWQAYRSEVAAGAMPAEFFGFKPPSRSGKKGCEAPLLMPGGQLVSCRKCNNCRAARRDALVGRLLAEQRVSPWSGVVTLTYGTQDWYDLKRLEGVSGLKALMLTYPDAQKYLMRLRNAMPGQRVRYYVAGEYGSEKGRAHWHAAIFAGCAPPNVVYDERYVHWAETPEQAVELASRYSRGKPLWSEGWSWWSEASVEAFAYMAKYVTKSSWGAVEPGEQRVQGWSSRPPLGADWIRHVWANKFVEHGLAPQDLRYNFADVNWPDGNPRRFFMRSKALARHFLDGYVEGWRAIHGNDRWPWSELVDLHVEDMRRRYLRRAKLPAMPEFEFDEHFYLSRYDKPGRWRPLLLDGGRSKRETFFPENWEDYPVDAATDPNGQRPFAERGSPHRVSRYGEPYAALGEGRE